RLPGVRRRARALGDRVERRLVGGRGWQPAAARLGRDLVALRLPGRTAAGSGLLLAASWLSDGACLLAAFEAVGSTPPWRGLLLCYCAAALVSALPLLPGGVGVVEGGLTVALVAYGSERAPALAAVLLYRLLSFWALLPIGGLAYLLLRREPIGPNCPVPNPGPHEPSTR
ncbi:MAG: YbhN family protein, partial [Actinomycetota bacterium]|nr:YbhN family protein [Actinomycetota bacterium]